MGSDTPDILSLPLTEEHLDAIADLDARVRGQERREYFRLKLARTQQENRVSPSLVAMHDDKLIGFVMGDVLVGEFGVEGATVAIDTLGVEPGYRRQGVGNKLMKDYLANVRALGMVRVVTFVDWNDPQLLWFFSSHQFEPARAIALERKL